MICAPAIARASGFAFDTDRTSLGAPSPHSVYPRVAAGGNSIQAMWVSPFGLTDRPFRGDGRTAGSDSVLSPCFPECMIDSWRIAAVGSNVWATWVQVDEIDGAPREQVYVEASTDSGQSWGAAQRISDPRSVSWFPEIAAAGAKAYVVWADGKGLRLRTIDGTVPRPETQLLATSFRLGSARVAAAQDGLDEVTVAWQFGSSIMVETSSDAGTTRPSATVESNLELEGLAMTPSYIRVLAAESGLGKVVLLSSDDSGGSYSTAELLANKNCALGCSPGDVAALDDRVAAAYEDAGSIYVVTGKGSSLRTSRVGPARSYQGLPHVALTPTTTGVVWSGPTDGYSTLAAASR